MGWRVTLIDSCGHWPGARDAAAFVSDGQHVERREVAVDPSGHGSRIAQLFTGGDQAVELKLAQVFLDERAASAAALAAAVDWAAAGHAELIHMSLGLKADRGVLAAAIARAVAAGCIVVASSPARGAPVYPAGYASVIRATGDARCAPGEVSCLHPWLFGGCPRFASAGDSSGALSGMRGASVGISGGASVGAAHVTRAIIRGPKHESAAAMAAALAASARFLGPESRGSVPAAPHPPGDGLESD